jgi:hypothetical protein
MISTKLNIKKRKETVAETENVDTQILKARKYEISLQKEHDLLLTRLMQLEANPLL